MLEKLSFEIQESPVLYSVNGEILTSSTHKVIIKVDSNFQLSVMKNSYNPMLNSDFMETTERMKEISGFEFSGYSEIDNGRILLAHMKNNLKDFSIDGNKIEDYLLLGSSHDGRFSFFVGTTTVLIRCKNQFSHITQAEKVRHTKSAPKRREDLMRSLDVYFQARKMMYSNFDKMLTVKVDEKLKQDAIDYILGISKEDRLDSKISTRKLNIMEVLNQDISYEMGDLGKNAFGLLNGVTKFTTHHREQKESIFGNVFGSNADINNRAYEFAMDLMK